MATKPPTVQSVDTRLDGVEQKLSGIAENVSDVRASIQRLGGETEERYTQLLSALDAVGGLNEIGRGLSEISEVLAPMRGFALPSTAQPLEPGVAAALENIRSALGKHRDLNFTNLVTEWDGPVGFIGEPVPEVYEPTGYSREE